MWVCSVDGPLAQGFDAERGGKCWNLRELVQSELANAALYRDPVQIESDNVGVYLFLQRPFPERPHKRMADSDDLLQEYRRMHMRWLKHDQEHLTWNFA